MGELLVPSRSGSWEERPKTVELQLDTVAAIKAYVDLGAEVCAFEAMAAQVAMGMLSRQLVEAQHPDWTPEQHSAEATRIAGQVGIEARQVFSSKLREDTVAQQQETADDGQDPEATPS